MNPGHDKLINQITPPLPASVSPSEEENSYEPQKASAQLTQVLTYFFTCYGFPTSLSLLFFAMGTKGEKKKKDSFPDMRGQEQRLYHTVQHSGLEWLCEGGWLSCLAWRWWGGGVCMTLFL